MLIGVTSPAHTFQNLSLKRLIVYIVLYIWRSGLCYDQLATNGSAIIVQLPIITCVISVSIFVYVLFTKQVMCLRVRGAATYQRQQLVASPSSCFRMMPSDFCISTTLICQWGTNNIRLPNRWRHLSSSGWRVRKLWVVCLHNNAFVARCILDTNIALQATSSPSILLVLLEPHWNVIVKTL